MHYVISFESEKFDLDNEEENSINPIKGKSVGEWMKNLLKQDGVQVTKVYAEDWGWYIYATYQENKYLVGFIGIPSESTDMAAEIIVQVNKNRSFIESILGKNKLTENDIFLGIIQRHVTNLKDVTNIEINKND